VLVRHACRDRQRARQTDKPVCFHGSIAPPAPNAPSSECPPNVVPNCEFRTCPNPEFPNALHSKFMNTPNVELLNARLLQRAYSIPCRQKMVSSAVLRLVLEPSTRCLQRAHSIGRGCRVTVTDQSGLRDDLEKAQQCTVEKVAGQGQWPTTITRPSRQEAGTQLRPMKIQYTKMNCCLLLSILIINFRKTRVYTINRV